MDKLIETQAWRDIEKHVGAMQAKPLADLILTDNKRIEHCEVSLEGLRLNYAFNDVTAETIQLLVKLAEQRRVVEWREKMFRGEKINNTEKRAALHTALRQRSGATIMVDGHDVMQDVKAAHSQMAKFVTAVREGKWKGATGQPIRAVVNIGIGGSDLGPRLAVEALTSFASGPAVHFVSNADAFDLLSVLKRLDPATTLFVIVSKTFTTQEALLNAGTARKWLVAKLGPGAVSGHFVAVTAHSEEAGRFGIPAANIFPLWDWVGGRFSLWSCVGLSIALALGMDQFEKLLDGAAAMDLHFRTTPLDKNLPVLLALLGIWQRNFKNNGIQAVLPYSERLRNLPRYLQQLEMESGGKSVTRESENVACETSPVVFGECGTVGQHSFYQWLHQGSNIVPADFIGITTDDLGEPAHHEALLTNMIAQIGALAFGKVEAKQAQDIYPGGRPSNLIMLDRLDPYCLGLLLAMYEHKVFVQGVIWGIDSFDQPGVELGKKMARDLKMPASPKNEKEQFLSAFLDRFAHKAK